MNTAIDLKDCSLIFKDGATTPHTLEFKFDEGNLTFQIKRNIEVKRDRGNLDYAKEGDEEPVSLSFEGRFSEVVSSSGGDVSPIEFLTFTGAASAYVSTAQVCAANAIDLVVEVDRSCGTTVQDEVTTFSDFTFETIDGDYKAGTISVSGIAMITMPTSVRTTL